MLGGQQRATIHAQLKSSFTHLRNSQCLTVMSEPVGHDASRNGSPARALQDTHGHSILRVVAFVACISPRGTTCAGVRFRQIALVPSIQRLRQSASTVAKYGQPWPSELSLATNPAAMQSMASRGQACFHWRPMKLQCKVWPAVAKRAFIGDQ
jgi:hypothetical protein